MVFNGRPVSRYGWRGRRSGSLPWVLILFVKSSVGGRLRRGTVDGYLICMAGVQARVLTPSERRRMETLVSPRAILIVRPFNRFDSARCAVKR